MPFDEHDVGQQSGDFHRVDVDTPRYRAAGQLAAPVEVGLFEPRVGERRRRGRLGFDPAADGRPVDGAPPCAAQTMLALLDC